LRHELTSSHSGLVFWQYLTGERAPLAVLQSPMRAGRPSGQSLSLSRSRVGTVPSPTVVKQAREGAVARPSMSEVHISLKNAAASPCRNQPIRLAPARVGATAGKPARGSLFSACSAGAAPLAGRALSASPVRRSSGTVAGPAWVRPCAVRRLARESRWPGRYRRGPATLTRRRRCRAGVHASGGRAARLGGDPNRNRSSSGRA